MWRKSKRYFPGTGFASPANHAPARGQRRPIGGAARRRWPLVARLSCMRITVPAGGVGAARFLRGLRAAVPDAVIYTLGGGISEEQGWGRDGESHVVLSELAAYGAGPGWFGLGDLDIATHILRTQLPAEGRTLSEATRVLCDRWQ